jgi:lantibiotic biosynthesis protein
MILHDEFLVRTPMRPLSGARALLAGSVVDDRALQIAFDDPLVQEAIYLASPSLFNAVQRWQRGELSGSAQAAAKRSLLKYLLRMGARPTPFGLFATCSAGRFDSESRGALAPESTVRRRAGLEMAVVCTLIETLERDPDVRPHLSLRPNDTLLAVGDDLRYVEYVYEDDKRQRAHRTVAIERNPYLDGMLAAARGGATIDALALAVADDRVSAEEAAAYAGELLENQVLRSNLAPAMTGADPLTRLLDELPGTAAARARVEQVRAALAACESADGNAWRPRHQSVRDAVSALIPDVPESLVTIDTYRPGDISLPEDVRASITKALHMLRRWVPCRPNARLEEFRKTFRERFADREVPLLRALDPDLGVPYGARPAPPAPLIDGVDMAPREPDEPAPALTPAEQWLLARIGDALDADAREIAITDDDIAALPFDNPAMPASSTATFALVSVNGRRMVAMAGAAGASAAAILGRFARLDDRLLGQLEAVARHEQEVFDARIAAEVLHMPTDRAGNVMARPAIRRCEIPVLAHAAVPREDVLALEDLLLSVPESGPFRLRSRRLDRDVVPMFGHAHRYDLPEMISVYRLLGDMQADGRLGALGLPLSRIEKLVPRMPRITYEGCVLAPAQWHLDKAAIGELVPMLASGGAALAEWQRARRVPEEIRVIEHDHELIANLANADSRVLLAHELKGKSSARLEECLWPDEAEPWISSSGHGFRAEVMASVFCGPGDR